MTKIDFAVPETTRRAISYLSRSGVECKVHNGGHHLVIERWGVVVDFWPANGKWRDRQFGKLMRHSGAVGVCGYLRGRESEARMMNLTKPHIRLSRTILHCWSCTGLGYVSTAATPREAYLAWKRATTPAPIGA